MRHCAIIAVIKGRNGQCSNGLHVILFTKSFCITETVTTYNLRVIRFLPENRNYPVCAEQHINSTQYVITRCKNVAKVICLRPHKHDRRTNLISHCGTQVTNHSGLFVGGNVHEPGKKKVSFHLPLSFSEAAAPISH